MGFGIALIVGGAAVIYQGREWWAATLAGGVCILLGLLLCMMAGSMPLPPPEDRVDPGRFRRD